MILLEPEDVRFNHDMTSIRVTGRVLESLPEEGVKGKRLGIDINLNNKISLSKNDEVIKYLKLVDTASYKDFLVVAIDVNGVALARIGNDIKLLEEVYLPSSKFYEITGNEADKTIRRVLEIARKIKEEEGIKIVAAVNVSTKNAIKKYRNLIDIVIEGGFTGTLTGVIQILKDSKLRKMIVGNRVLKNIETYEKLLKNMFSNRVIYGTDDVKYAIESKGIKNLYVNYQRILDEPSLIDYIILSLRNRISVSIADKNDFLGLAISRFGGLVGVY
jgi:stalled ribosome rescue protein Dom34